MTNDADGYLARIAAALEESVELASTFSPSSVYVQHKGWDGPVTEADHALDELLHDTLVRPGEGWLSEETVDDGHRIGMERVWVVDPIDGTRGFLAGRPEWCVSVAMSVDGVIGAAGIVNPWANETFLAARGGDMTLNGQTARVNDHAELSSEVTVLGSRAEIRWGMWNRFHGAPFKVQTLGSIAYKMALVAAGKADAVISLEPKNEWDVAAGALLVEAAGGVVTDADGRPMQFNRRDTLIDGVIAAGPKTHAAIWELMTSRPSTRNHTWTPGRH